MTTLGNIYDYIDSFAPYSTQLGYDNSGLLIGSREDEVRSCALCLSATAQTVIQAVEFGCGALIAHHPVMFGGIKRLTPDQPEFLLVRGEVGFLCAHTNLDLAEDGVNTALARKLGVLDAKPYGLECGLVGWLPNAMSAQELARHVCRKLSCDAVTLTGDAQEITRVAVIGGCGEDYLLDALAAGAQAVVTGEAGFHYLQAALDAGVTVITAGHHKTECVVLEPLCEKLEKQFPDVHFCILAEDEPYTVVTKEGVLS